MTNRATTRATTVHINGTVDYWSVYKQQWMAGVHCSSVPDRELAAMPESERLQVIAAQMARGCRRARR